MSKTVKKWAKRQGKPVKDGDEIVAHVRALKIGEVFQFDSLPDDLKPWFMLGKGLVNDSGDQEIEVVDGESAEDFAKRAKDVLAEMPSDVAILCGEVIKKLQKPPNLETAIKN